MPSASKATYSLDSQALAKLSRLAHRWQVSKTEVLRRLITQADQPATLSADERIAALHRLQKRLKERGVDFDAWQKAIRDGRR